MYYGKNILSKDEIKNTIPTAAIRIGDSHMWGL